MGKFDKDRYQKELALRYCLGQRMVPFLEVVVASASNLSDAEEVLTDLDVVGVAADSDGAQRHVFFDCKSSRRLSAVNRAFWASGVRTFVGFDQGYVVQGARPLTNHRLSALTLNIDLHDESSFVDLGRRSDEGFPSDRHYQSSIQRWDALYSAYEQCGWSKRMFGLVRHQVPLSKAPWTTFRHIIVELRRTRGEYDPGKPNHLAIFLDVLASAMVLWGALGRDISRFYEANMDKVSFERVLRYYIWGGKDGFNARMQLAKLAEREVRDLPAWEGLVDFATITVAAPKGLLSCAHVFRELAIRAVTQAVTAFDDSLRQRFSEENRLRQFMLGMNAYLVEAGELPNDMRATVDELLLADYEAQ